MKEVDDEEKEKEEVECWGDEKGTEGLKKRSKSRGWRRDGGVVK